MSWSYWSREAGAVADERGRGELVARWTQDGEGRGRWAMEMVMGKEPMRFCGLPNEPGHALWGGMPVAR